MSMTALIVAGCLSLNINPTASQPLHTITPPVLGSCVPKISNGYPIPDPLCTPGAINPTITTKVLQNPAFHTRCIRQKITTESQKEKTYLFYNISKPIKNKGRNEICELDHLIPIELGGADTVDNIWPQCGPSGVMLNQRFFKEKDRVEDFLAQQVRTNKITLSDAQYGIASDWTQYLNQIGKRKHR